MITRVPARRAVSLLVGVAMALGLGVSPTAALIDPNPPPDPPPTGGVASAGTITMNGDGTIQYTGTPGVTNHVVITQPTTTTLRITDLGSITVNSGLCSNVSGNADQADCDVSGLATSLPLHVALGDGNDYFSATGSSRGIYVEGGSGDDSIYGSAGNDQLIGDSSDATAGNDIIYGGPGNDLIRGDSPPPPTGNSFRGDGGNDRLYGGTGADTLRGEGGDDYLEGDEGPDTLVGDSGTDTVSYDDPAHDAFSTGVTVNPTDGQANDGNAIDSVDIGYPYDRVDNDSVEIIVGTTHNDTITASGGQALLGQESTVRGLAGDDTLTSNPPTNAYTTPAGSTLDGGDGNDTINGGQGADTLIGGNGSDVLTCGPSADTATIDGLDTITDTSCETVNTPMSMAVADAPAVTEGVNPTATFTITLSGGAHGSQLGAHYQTVDGTADASDYTPTSGDVHFAAGSNTATVEVPITDDQSREPDQAFKLRITSLNQMATVSRDTGIAVIHDNGDPLPTLSVDKTYPNGYPEGADPQGRMFVRVSLSQPTGYNVTATVTPTATSPGDDFTTTPVQVTIPAGQSAASVMATTVPDDRVEKPDETVTFVLSSPTNATLDPNSFATFTIKDNDANISIGDASATEATGGIDFPVTLDRAVDHDIVLAYSTADGAAKAGTDYTASSGTVTVHQGQTSAMIHVPIADDSVYNGDRAFTLSVRWADSYPNPTEGIVRTTATGTIHNDDAPVTMTNTNPPAIIGTPVFGHTLSVSAGSWSTTPSSFSYQWQRDGRPITRATGATYRITAADVGHHIRVVVTAHRYGYTSPSAASVAVRIAPAAAPRLVGTRPHLAGIARVGHRLTILGGRAWSPRGVTLTYSWYRNGHLIRVAHGRSYLLRRIDRHTRIKALVVAHLPGHRNGLAWTVARWIR